MCVCVAHNFDPPDVFWPVVKSATAGSQTPPSPPVAGVMRGSIRTITSISICVSVSVSISIRVRISIGIDIGVGIGIGISISIINISIRIISSSGSSMNSSKRAGIIITIATTLVPCACIHEEHRGSGAVQSSRSS